MSTHALVLAGFDHNEPLSQHFQVASKALVPVAGKPLAYYALQALQQSQVAENIIYIGHHHAQLEPFYDSQLEPSSSILENLQQGIAQAQQQGASDILLVSADIVWLQAEDLGDFLSQARTRKGELIYPVISATAVRAQFPRQTQRQFARVRPDAHSPLAEFTGGSVIFVRQAAIEPMLAFAERAYHARKNLWALAQLLGMKLALQFLRRRLAIPEVEARVSHLLGISAQALRIERAGLAMDVDTLEELAHAEADLAL